MASSYRLSQSGVATTMSICALLTGMPAHAEPFRPSEPKGVYRHIEFLNSFVSSTPTDVSLGHVSASAMTEFGKVVDTAYRDLASAQRSLDPNMESILADSLWDLYITD